MQITIIYELDPHSETDKVFAVMQDMDDAQKAVTALNAKAKEAGRAAYGEDWEEYARHYYAKESLMITSRDIISSL